VLNFALATGVPVARPIEPVPIVRPFARRPVGFDPRELLGPDVVLTVPVLAGGMPPADEPRPGLN
jgi:hypothetical protein